MNFTSASFLILFLPLTLVAYYLVRSDKIKNTILCIASLVFYAFSGFYFVFLLLFTCILDYFVGKRLHVMRDGNRRKWLFVSCVAIQIFLLCVFKYTEWLTGEIQVLFAFLGFSIVTPTIALPLPPGISFYTFHSLSYTADIYRRQFKPQGNLLDYITFVSFFPQLVAGPIARASKLLPQVVQSRDAPSAKVVEEAAWLIFWGLFKKIVFADRFGEIVAGAERAIQSGQGDGYGALFMYAFAFQIYCDFSAYTDIARGIAKLFGIELARNFNAPYFASSPSDFWQRWHISLSSWFRDYLYVPLGGNRFSRLLTFRNLLITMALAGLWHGAGPGYVIWGLYHGLLLVGYHALKPDEHLVRLFGRPGKVLTIILMFHLVCLGWIFFRAAPDQIAATFGALTVTEVSTGLSQAFLPFLMLAGPIFVTELIGFSQKCEFVDVYKRLPFIIRTLLLIGVIQGSLFLGARSPVEFLYFQF